MSKRVWENLSSTTAAVSQVTSRQSRTHGWSIMSCFITRLLLPLRHTVWGSAIDYTFCTLLLLLSVLSDRGEQKYELSQGAAADGITSQPPQHTDNSLCVSSLRKLQKYVDFCAITYAIVQWCALVCSNSTEAPLLLSNETKRWRPLLSHQAEHCKGGDGCDDYTTHETATQTSP